MTTIFLVRHGSTDWTGHRIIGNLPGVHLNENGRQQAENAAEHLRQFQIQAIFASPMERALETAVPLSARLGISIQPKEFLREINFGELQGMGEELQTSVVWQRFQTHPADVTFPGGESVTAAQQRVVTGLNELSEEHGANAQIACFTHCEILRLSIAYCLRMPLDEFPLLTIKPASISCVEWEKDTQQLSLLNFQPA